MVDRTVFEYRVGDLIQGTTVKGPSVPITRKAQTPTQQEKGIWEIECAYGIYVVRYNEILQFPRRLDGSVKNWMTSDTNPLPSDLAIGDIIPPARSIDEIVIPGLRLPPGITWESYYAKYYQRVISVQKYLNTGTVLVIAVTDYEPDGRERPTRRTFGFRMEEEVAMPRTEWKPYQAKTFSEIDGLGKAGPYELISNHDTEYWFLVHPTGKGRWPSGTPEFEIIEEPGTYIMRPPSGASPDVTKAWRLFREKYTNVGQTSFLPHPQDRTKRASKKRYENWKMSHPRTS